MQRSLLPALPVLLGCLSLALAPADGCEPNTYLPSPPRSPLFDGQGEIHLAGYYGSSGFGAEAAYALGSNIGLGAAYWGRESRDDSSAVYERHNAVELAATWFATPMGMFRIEGGAGLGIGSGSGTPDSAGSISIVDGDYIRPFVQGTLGFVPFGTGDDALRLEMAGTVRFSYVGFTAFQRLGADVEPLPRATLIEPGLLVRFGLPTLMLDVSYGVASSLNDDPDFNYGTAVLTLGVRLVLRRGDQSERSPRRR